VFTAETDLRTGNLPFAQNKFDRPAAPDMGSRSAEVVEDGRVGAACLFQGVGQDREEVGVQRAFGQPALLVGAVGQGPDGGGPPTRPSSLTFS
jgi:hypothetical protein